jgi:hypothetical protein
MKLLQLAIVICVGICLGRAQVPPPALIIPAFDFQVTCSLGLSDSGCRDAQRTVQSALADLRPSVRDWRFIVVPDERWEATCKGFGLKPCVPAFSNLTMRATYLNARLAVLIDRGKPDEELAAYTRLTGKDRLEWALAHELGHILCGTANQDVAETAALSLRAGRNPGGCPVYGKEKMTAPQDPVGAGHARPGDHFTLSASRLATVFLSVSASRR